MTKRNETPEKGGLVDLTENRTLKKKQTLRNNEYYTMQDIFDELYRKSADGHVFKDLMQLIASEENILLAYRNIKNNKGSQTKGTDNRDISYFAKWEEAKFISVFQSKLDNYQPKSVKRVEIPKDYQPGKTRPLGIPCMEDRIIQQCIRQVLEPICEAKFHDHSYGFRPNRAASHAIARMNFLLWRNQLHYVVDIDIKGFFDNVHHGKLLKQMWSMGIQDKSLLCVISKILKSEIHGIGKPSKGTPQGGIISPLLSNIVLNELDWWLSNQWESKTSKHPYTHVDNRRAALKKSSNLKEFFFVRYADDFKILCKDYDTAQKIFEATKQWLHQRLGLEISPEKSRITNVRKNRTEFLGFALKVKKKRNKFVSQSNITPKTKKAIITKLKSQIQEMQKNTEATQSNKLNAMILGMHNYYAVATQSSKDFSEISYIVNKSLYNRLKRHISDSAKKSQTYLKFYGAYNGKVTSVFGVPIFPIYACKYKAPYMLNQSICSYTVEGRKLIHDRLNNLSNIMRYLLANKEWGKSTEYNDNRISRMAGQQGKCFVTKEALKVGQMVCHHKKPLNLGGTDAYTNLVWLKGEIHLLVMATSQQEIQKHIQNLGIDASTLKKVNSLRLLSGNSEIE